MALMSNSFKGFCIGACIFVMLVSLSINFVLGLHVFPTNMGSPIVNQSEGGIVGENATKVASGDFLSVMSTIGSAVGFGGLILVAITAWQSKSYNIVAAYIFTWIFWQSWFTNIGFFVSMTNYSAIVPIWTMLTAVVGLLFVGAVSGILGGVE